MGYIEDIRKVLGHQPLILPGSAVILENSAGQILLQQRREPMGKWGLPGGLMELGESTEETAKRELLEESGLILGKLTLLGVYSGKDYFFSAQNGDQWYIVTATYLCNDFSGEVRVNDGESLQFQWFDPDKLPGFFAGTHQTMINDYLRKKSHW